MKIKLLSKITGIACMVIVFFSTILATELLDDIADTIQDKLDEENNDHSKTGGYTVNRSKETQKQQ